MAFVRVPAPLRYHTIRSSQRIWCSPWRFRQDYRSHNQDTQGGEHRGYIDHSIPTTHRSLPRLLARARRHHQCGILLKNSGPRVAIHPTPELAVCGTTIVVRCGTVAVTEITQFLAPAITLMRGIVLTLPGAEFTGCHGIGRCGVQEETQCERCDCNRKASGRTVHGVSSAAEVACGFPSVSPATILPGDATNNGESPPSAQPPRPPVVPQSLSPAIRAPPHRTQSPVPPAERRTITGGDTTDVIPNTSTVGNLVGTAPFSSTEAGTALAGILSVPEPAGQNPRPQDRL